MIKIILAATGKRDPRKYGWLTYKGRKATIKAKNNSGIEFSFEIEKGDNVGVKIKNGVVYIVLGFDLSVQLKLVPFDSDRILKHSEPYEGKIGTFKVSPYNANTDSSDSLPRDVKVAGKKLTRIKIDSSMFRKGLYDAKKRSIVLEFRSGAVWEYLDVSPEEVLEFERAKSQGKWYNTYIKGEKEGQRVKSKL